MRKFISYLCYSFTDWVFRRQSPALFAMRIGMGCLALSMGAGWAFDIKIPYSGGTFSLSVNNGNGTPAVIIYVVVSISVLLIIGGFIWEIYRYRGEQKRLQRKKIIVIENRGLRDTSGTPLDKALPKTLIGNTEQMLVDIRQHDGFILSPEAALSKIISIPNSLRERENGLNRDDITIVYGGLMPVPFTFLSGVLLDDEGQVITLDWDRHSENWRTLDGEDDGARFKVSGLDTIPAGAIEVALAVSVSYGVDINGVQQKINGMALIHMELDNGSPDCHWSEEKQKALGKEFLNTVIALGNQGIKKIHLFLAAQNSVVFRFGRLYDKRNLPQVIVYQYQREETPPYPWGILMPLHGNQPPSIVR